MAADKESPAIGIDLGTSFSCVAVVRNGKVEIIPNEDVNFTTHSCVAFMANQDLIGDAAHQQISLNATNTIVDSKTLIGRDFDDEIVQKHMKRWPFKVISVDGCPKVEVIVQNEVKYLSAVEVSAMILGKVKRNAEAYLNATVTKAVIACPAYFNVFQRRATIKAGKIAGFDVLKLVDEPIATGIAYGANIDPKTSKKILVCDLGAGTFDASIVNICNNQVTIVAKASDTRLGGQDLDNLLMKNILREIKLKHKKDIKNDRTALSRLRTACELTKRTLSTSKFAAIEIDALSDGVDFKCNISHTRFENVCSGLFDTTIKIVKSLLKDAKLSSKDINEIVLVGGNSQIPKIQQLLRNEFKFKDINQSLNPDQAVAYGAAILAPKNEWNCVDDLELTQVTHLSLGIAVQYPDRPAEDEEMWPLIKRNTPIPVMRSQIFSIIRNQTTVYISILRGENRFARENNVIGKFVISGIPHKQTGVEKITVKMSIDQNNILTVTAFSHSNQKVKGELIIRSEVGKMILETQLLYNELGEESIAVYIDDSDDLAGYSYKVKTKADEINAVTQNRNKTVNWSICGSAAMTEVIEKRSELLQTFETASTIEMDLENGDLSNPEEVFEKRSELLQTLETASIIEMDLENWDLEVIKKRRELLQTLETASTNEMDLENPGDNMVID